MSTVCGVDWFSVTAWLSLKNDLTGMDVAQFLGLSGLEKFGNGARGYRFVHRNKNTGAALYESPYEQKNGEHFNLELPGSACNLVDAERFRELFMYLEQNFERWHITRLDMSVDTDLITTNNIANAIVAGDFKTHCSPNNIQRIHDLAGQGDTIYVGSKESATRLRMYKKQIIDHDVFNQEWFTRLELQLRDERANGGYKFLAMSSLEGWPMIMKSSINEFFSLETNWWADWMREAQKGILVKIKHPAKTLAKTANWLNSQVAPSLAMYLTALSGGDVLRMKEIFEGLLHEGKEKWSSSHRQAMENYYHEQKLNADEFGGIYWPIDTRALDDPMTKQITDYFQVRMKEKLQEKRLEWSGVKRLTWSTGSAEAGDFRTHFMWVFDEKKYQDELAKLSEKDFREPAAKLPEQLSLPINDSIASQAINHYDVP